MIPTAFFNHPPQEIKTRIMISNTDLRLGNIVESDGKLMIVIHLFEWEIGLQEPEAKGDLLLRSADDINGVCLCEQLLLRYGFTKTEGKDFDVFWTKDKFGVSYCKVPHSPINEAGKFYLHDFKEVSYLHDLQNYYYFGANKKELTINTKTP